MSRLSTRATLSAHRGARSLAALAVLALIAAVGAFGATGRATVVPSNTSPPTISGTAAEGSTLTTTNGTWNGTQPISYGYHWQRCDTNGANCANISGAVQSSYVLRSVDDGNTLRMRVTATNRSGSTGATSVPTAVVKAAPVTGCPAAAAGATVDVNTVGSPARLVVDQFQAVPAVIPGSMQSFSLRLHVADTCGQPVSGALVLATAVPYNQVTVPPETATGSDGWVTLNLNRLGGFPATSKQRLMVVFVRARKATDSPLSGITGSRLVSFPVRVHA